MGGDLNYGLIITLFGMGIVFLLLIILAYVIQALKLISGGKDKAKSDIKADAQQIAAKAPTYSPAQADVQSSDDSELIAAITAALAIYMGGNAGVIVKSIRRVGDSTPVWGSIGRSEQMHGRL